MRLTGHKYGARPTEALGQRFPSHLEAHTYAHLWQQQKARVIYDLKRQVRVHLVCGIRLNVDFSYVHCATNMLEFAESKGFSTPEWLLKQKLWRTFGAGVLWVYVRSGRGVKISERIAPDLGAHGRDDLTISQRLLETP